METYTLTKTVKGADGVNKEVPIAKHVFDMPDNEEGVNQLFNFEQRRAFILESIFRHIGTKYRTFLKSLREKNPTASEEQLGLECENAFRDCDLKAMVAVERKVGTSEAYQNRIRVNKAETITAKVASGEITAEQALAEMQALFAKK